MRHWPTTVKRKSRIEIIPMIDVMMFLLVFFVLISVNVIPVLGVKTQLPSSSQSQLLKTPTRQVVVSLAKEGRILVDGNDVGINALVAAVRAKARADEKVAIIINSDKGAEVQLLIEVMDELKTNGLDSVSIAARLRS
jgi:biopolymer transport protein ExbD